MKCICHSFHLCASYACEQLPTEIEKFTRDVYNYFSNSPKRIGDYKEFKNFANASPVKILHPAATRWLSLESVVKRLCSQYNALTLYFTEQALQKENLHAISIYNCLCNPETRLYLEFLSYALSFFSRLNIIMQSEKPQIQVLYREVSTTVKCILESFIRQDVLDKTNLADTDFKNPRNFVNLNNMYFGAFINSSNIPDTNLQNVKKRCLSFYKEGVKQILSRISLKESVFQKLVFMDPENVRNKKIISISDVVTYFSNLNLNLQEVDTEWRHLRALNFSEFDLCEENDVIIFWTKVSSIKLGNCEPQFQKLCSCVFNLLCLPHSSANVERYFSQINLNKTATRNRLKSNTLEALLLTKDLVSENGECHNFKINKTRHIQKC